MYEFDEGAELSKYFYGKYQGRERLVRDQLRGKQRLEEKQGELYGGAR